MKISRMCTFKANTPLFKKGKLRNCIIGSRLDINHTVKNVRTFIFKSLGESENTDVLYWQTQLLRCVW